MQLSGTARVNLSRSSLYKSSLKSRQDDEEDLLAKVLEITSLFFMAFVFSLFRTRLELVASPHTADLIFAIYAWYLFFHLGKCQMEQKSRQQNYPFLFSRRFLTRSNFCSETFFLSSFRIKFFATNFCHVGSFVDWHHSLVSPLSTIYAIYYYWAGYGRVL